MFFEVLRSKLKQGTKTVKDFSNITLPDNYLGMPVINPDANEKTILKCEQICPTKAISSKNKSIDLGKCIFCGECNKIQNQNFITFSGEFKMSASSREDLIIDTNLDRLAEQSKKTFDKVFGRCLNLRQISAGGCNSCEADINVLSTPVFDLARFGIHFTASPRHADGILVTGPVTKNMKEAVIDTYNAVPNPKFVIAAGACAISGGIFRDFKEQMNGLQDLIPIDLYIPGCPPHPLTTLYALLNFFNSPKKNIFGD